MRRWSMWEWQDDSCAQHHASYRSKVGPPNRLAMIETQARLSAPAYGPFHIPKSLCRALPTKANASAPSSLISVIVFAEAP